MTVSTLREDEARLTESALAESITPMAPKHRAAMRYQHHLWDATSTAAHTANNAIWILDNAGMLEVSQDGIRRQQARLEQACRHIRHTLRAMRNDGDQYPQTAALQAITSRHRYGFRIVAMLIAGLPQQITQREIHSGQ